MAEQRRPGTTWITGLNAGHGEDRLTEWRVSMMEGGGGGGGGCWRGDDVRVGLRCRTEDGGGLEVRGKGRGGWWDKRVGTTKQRSKSRVM